MKELRKFDSADKLNKNSAIYIFTQFIINVEREIRGSKKAIGGNLRVKFLWNRNKYGN